MRLKEKVAIITGVSHAGQAGYALARAFAREGARLTICSRNQERVNARAQELRSEDEQRQVLAIAADLTTEEGARMLIQKTVETYGRIDILVNLAGGLTKYGPSDELKLADWESELNNNLLTALLCTQAVWPIMKRQGSGKILNFSRAGRVEDSPPMMVAYNCAKAGVDALTRTFAREGEPAGIYVNALGPGLLTTESNITTVNSHLRSLTGGLLHLDSTATLHTFAGVQLWLRCPMHQGTVTRCLSWSSRAGPEAFSRPHSSRQSDRHAACNDTQGSGTQRASLCVGGSHQPCAYTSDRFARYNPHPL